MPLLDVRNLSATYGEVQALRDVSFTVELGETVTILGANGAGKSTTIRCIAGIHRQAQGEITMQGSQILGRTSHSIAKLGTALSPEGRHVFGTLTVRENLLIGGYKRKGRRGLKEDLDRWYATFPKLADRSEQRAGTLSGGEQQMLAIARAMMGRPQLLMLDEPSLGLAPVIIERMAATLADIADTGDMAVLLVEQNVNLALRLAHRGYVLRLGEVVFSGASSEMSESGELAEAYLGTSLS